MPARQGLQEEGLSQKNLTVREALDGKGILGRTKRCLKFTERMSEMVLSPTAVKQQSQDSQFQDWRALLTARPCCVCPDIISSDPFMSAYLCLKSGLESNKVDAALGACSPSQVSYGARLAGSVYIEVAWTFTHEWGCVATAAHGPPLKDHSVTGEP